MTRRTLFDKPEPKPEAALEPIPQVPLAEAMTAEWNLWFTGARSMGDPTLLQRFERDFERCEATGEVELLWEWCDHSFARAWPLEVVLVIQRACSRYAERIRNFKDFASAVAERCNYKPPRVCSSKPDAGKVQGKSE